MYSCSLCDKSGSISDFLYSKDICNKCIPKPTYHCIKCKKNSQDITNFLHNDNICNGCTPKPIYHCIECKKNSQDLTDFFYSIDICNGCTPPMYHCIGCTKSSRYISDFLISEKFCNKCVPNCYRNEGLLSVLQKWPATMAIIIFEELNLKGIIDLNIIDLQEFIGLDDIQCDENKFV
jgi:hypothetical protein